MATEIKLPNLGENIESGNVVNILVNEGDRVEKNQNVLELETDKASIEIPTDVAGIVEKIFVRVGDKVARGDRLLAIDNSSGIGAPSTAAVATKAPASTATPPVAHADLPPEPPPMTAPLPAEPATRKDIVAPVPAAPSTRRFAREIGIDIDLVRGSGKGGRIGIEDVKAFAKQQNLAWSATPAQSLSANRPLPDFTQWGAIERISMANIRAKTAENVSYAWATIPHVTQFDKADITDLEKQRKFFGERVEKAGGKLTVTAILLKILAVAMKRFPQFNASIDVANNQIVFKKYCHIGVAVDTDRGLLVPVIRDVNRKSILELSIELPRIAEQARQKKLALDDLQGGSFTLSNLGGIGGTAFTPIVRWPEVAILGVGRAAIEPVYMDGQFAPRRILTLALSYDHRVIDGADGARFLRWVAEALESPFLISLEG